MSFNPRYETMPERDLLPNYVFTPSVFTPEECKQIISDQESNISKWATVGDGISYNENLSYRAVKHAFIESNENSWIYERIRDEVWKANDIWKFDIHAMDENIQILRYDAQPSDSGIPAGHYDWHQDYGAAMASKRKISVVINLSDPSTYDGCELDIFTYQISRVIERDPGTMITFPSYLPHMVNSITKGTRFALVTWISGPPFR